MRPKNTILLIIISCCLAMVPVYGEDEAKMAVSAAPEEEPASHIPTPSGASRIVLPQLIHAAPEPTVEDLSVAPTVQPAVASVPVESEKTPVPNIFEREGLGYTISYPADWVYEEPTQYQIIFSGKQGTSAYYSTVSVQNVASKKLSGKHGSINSVKTSLIGQLNASAIDVRVSDEKPFTYAKKDMPKLDAAELVAEYTNNKTRFKQWIVIVERAGKEIYHIWSYTSPVEQYDAYLPAARDMLDSWMIK